mmetsp:Transcript_63717/g.166821  ORF Transcript_63717/g.166821 Transcript_63717/m.166821 type:complete len:219 (+) Transcript_63717:1576-2232(+)
MNVRTASQISTSISLLHLRMTSSQTYAKMDQTAVQTKTEYPLILLCSSAGTETMHTATIIKRLKAALPTIVAGPRGWTWKSSLKIPMTLSMISGALEPRAISVRFATVEFQTVVVVKRFSLAFHFRTLRVVTFSIAAMKTSATIATPWKDQPRKSSEMTHVSALESCLPPILMTKPSSQHSPRAMSPHTDPPSRRRSMTRTPREHGGSAKGWARPSFS